MRIHNVVMVTEPKVTGVLLPNHKTAIITIV